MSFVATFFKLDNKYKLLVIQALILLWMIRLILWVFSFSTVKNICGKLSISSGNQEVPLSRITWAVQVMSRFTPKATCLVRALAGQILLERYGYASSIKIGVSKSKDEFEAHAWLEYKDTIVLGESETDYIPILDMGKE
jgi:hypothetical protein